MQDGLPLSKRLAEALAKIGLAIRSRSWRGASPLGLTPTQGQVLTLLLSVDRPLRLGDVARGLGVTPATVSEAVSTLARKGLVEKRRQGRSLALTLTVAGRSQAEQAASWPDFLAQSLEKLPEQEQALLMQSVTKVLDDLSATDAAR